VGKTAFAMNLMQNAALLSGKTVAFFSLEMGSEQIVDRMLSGVAGIEMHKITK
jgi:replicative DNA helicase